MNTRFVIPDDYQKATASLEFLQAAPGVSTQILGDIARDPESAAALAGAAALILIRERTLVDEAFLARTPQLKLISQTGKLAKNVDVAACTRAGVAIVEGVGSPVAPAELTWLLIMAQRRKLVASVNGMKAGLWQSEIGEALAGQTLGILGFGKIGKKVAGYARAFDMRVQVWGSERARSEAAAAGLIVPASRQAFFADADILTVHQRLLPATQGNISAEDLAAMRTSALFVNTSRAELVAPGALLSALRRGRPGNAALDVFECEPVYDSADDFLALPNVLCTPHLGYVEKASYDLYFKTAFDNALRFFTGDTSHVLNPEVLGG